MVFVCLVATNGPTPSQLRALNTRVVTNAPSLCSEQPQSAVSERETAAPFLAVLNEGLGHPHRRSLVPDSS